MKAENNSNLKTTERFSPSSGEGLSSVQVKSRLEDGLVNISSQKYSKSYLSIFASNIFTIFNLLGLIVFISLLCVGAGLFDFVFVLVYIANFSIGIIQEIRAKKCIEKLSLVAQKNVKAIRDGKEAEIAATDIVLDDILKLGIGNQIPTDCIVTDGVIEVNESLLTGESVPIKKQAGDPLFAGSFIVAGRCIARADKVGKDNYVEQLSAKAKKYRKPRSELMSSLRFFIKAVAIVIVPMAAAYMIKSVVIVKESVPEAVRRTSAVVIGMIPSGMFLLTSLALAVGIIKLARQNTLVQDLYSLEMLARVDTICFDKTGTITDGKMTFVEEININPHDTSTEDIISSMLCELKDNNQTAIALYEKFGDDGKFTATAALPFNSARKLSAVTFDNKGTFAFGAPEFVLSTEEYDGIKPLVEKQTQKGLRVLVLAHSHDCIDEDKIPKDFSAISLLLIADNVREDAAETVAWFKENDVAIKVISGDNPITVSEVSKRVGIDDAENFISLDGLSDDEVYNAADKYTVFGRVSPDQKAILIKSLKDKGHTTAMTGDGVNDIIALKEADCAISVASGSEAARNVAHLVLMDDNFNHMPQVVHEGRRVINNVQSSASLYLMKTFFTMILAFIVLFIPTLKCYPFTLKQMNPLEMIIIGLASLSLSMQPNDSRVTGKFIANVIGKSLPAAIVMVLSVGAVGLISLFDTTTDHEVFCTMAILALTFAGLVNLFNICRPFNRFRTILFSIISALLIILLCITICCGMEFIGLTKLSPSEGHLYHLLELFAIIAMDFPLSIILNKLGAAIGKKIGYNKLK